MLRRSILRAVPTFRSYSKGKIYPKLNNAEELDKLMNTPSWNVSDAIPDPDSIEEDITPETVQKLLKQSGLPHAFSDELFGKLEYALRTQIGFIDELYEPGMSHGERCANNNRMFRLLASDHQPPEPLTLKDLLAKVDQVTKQVDPEKGEEGINYEAFRNTIKFGKS